MIAESSMKKAELIIGEGITEKYYFQSLRDILVIKPKTIELNPYNLHYLEKAIKEYANEGYTRIHCLIDMDNKISSESNMQKYKRFKQKYNHKKVGKTDCEVIVYESFPSIEIFFFYYFENSTSEKSNSGLKKWLNHKCGYEPRAKFLISHSLHELFMCNGGELENAIKNSKLSLKSRIDGNLNCSYSEIGNLIESLGLKQDT